MSFEDNNPWIVKTRKQVYETPWISVFHHDTINPSGNLAIYSTVEFKNLAIGIYNPKIKKYKF